MPSSKDRRRIEMPTHLYDRAKRIADAEERTITSVLNEIIFFGLQNYQPAWNPRVFMDRFDEAARRVLERAKEEAHLLNHNYLGTEHLLLGLLREEQGIAAEALRRLWVDLDKARAAVVEVIGRGDRPTPLEQIDYVPRVRKVLTLTVDEARTLEYDHVGPEHLLLGLVREGEGIAAGILESFGALRRAREVTLALMAQSTAAQPREDEQQTE